jgi:hypothetical protein
MPLAGRLGDRRPVAASTVPDPGRSRPPGRTRRGKGSVMCALAATRLLGRYSESRRTGTRLQPGRRIPGARRFPAFSCEPGDGSVNTRSGAMAGFDVPGGSAAMPRPERVARLQPGLAGFGSTTAAGGVTGAPAGKTAGWTRTPGFSLCCYHVNPRTYRTTSVFGGGPQPDSTQKHLGRMHST